jgi:peptidoglycan/LPS O-acetylase OafA/YrhL
MSLTVLQRMGARCYAVVTLPLAAVCYLIASTPIAGDPTTSPLGLSQALYKGAFYAVISWLALAPLALGNEGLYSRLLASRPMVWLGEISYEIFLIHLITMEFAMVYIMQDHVYTGSMAGLFVATVVITIPPAWLLHRFTRVRD